MTVLAVSTVEKPPGGWSELQDANGGCEFTQSQLWTDLAASHYPAARPRYIVAEVGGRLVGGLPLVARRRAGLVRLESSFDGTLGGPLLHPELEVRERHDVVRSLMGGVLDQLRGRTGLAVVTLAASEAPDLAEDPGVRRWRCERYESAIVDCREGLDHVDTALWTNNRRNERNRGLKRGCALRSSVDSGDIARWYPLYEAKARQWAQAPVPLGFLQQLTQEAPDRVCFDHVVHDGEIVAGHFCFVSRQRLVAWQGAARPDLARSHFLTTLLYWRNIETACERGLEGVDFGGCVGRDSLWEFKRRCGALPEERCQYLAVSDYGRLHRLVTDLIRGRGWRRQ